MADLRWCKCGGIYSMCRHKDKAPAVCAVCDVDLVLTLSKYDVARDYYCWQHCPSPKWQSDYDWPTECAHCGIERGDYWEAVVKGWLREPPQSTWFVTIAGTTAGTASTSLYVQELGR